MELIIKNTNIHDIGKALSNKTRIDILFLVLEKGEIDITRIAEEIKQTEANISAQVKILISSGLVKFRYEEGEHGVRKVISPTCEKLIIELI